MAKARKSVKRKRSASKKTATKKKTTQKKEKNSAKDTVEVKVCAVKYEPKSNNWFVLCSGKEIRNLKELAQDLGEMEDFVFNYHVNDQKNDFVNWVKDVFNDPHLAEKLSTVKDKKKAQIIVYEHILDNLW